MAWIKESLSPSKASKTGLIISEAATRSSLTALRQRANTASAIDGAAMPMSSALTEVHFPVPFWPAVSSTISTNGCPVTGSSCCRMSVVISMRNESSRLSFHFPNTSLICLGFMPKSFDISA